MFDFRFESDFIKNMILQEEKRIRAPSTERELKVQLIPIKIGEKPEFLVTIFLLYKHNSIFVLIIDSVALLMILILINSWCSNPFPCTKKHEF